MVGSISGMSAERGRGRGREPRPVVFRGGAGERLQRQVGLDRAVQAHDEAVLGDGLADDREIEVPLVEDGAGGGLLLGAEHHEHALLAFREHHLVGGHAGLAHRHAVEVEPDPEAALVAHLDRRAGQPGGAHVLDGDDRAGGHQLQARLHQPLLGEGVADLHRRALGLELAAELGARHRRAADAVAPGLGAEIDHRHADPAGGGVEDRVGAREAGGEGVDQAVAVVAGMEAQLAADRRHPEGVAVAADAGDDAAHQPAGLRVVGRAERQRVHRRDRPRAHGEDVAQDAADAGGGALVGLDVGGVVVALHLEDQRHPFPIWPVADVDDARVLARAADHLRAGGGQGAQPLLRGLVGAVLVPHRREDAELGQRGGAADQLENARVLLGLQPVRRDELGRDLGVLHRALRRLAPVLVKRPGAGKRGSAPGGRGPRPVSDC